MVILTSMQTIVVKKKGEHRMNQMMQQYVDKAQILIEALPYIQRFNQKVIVVKYGGSAMKDANYISSSSEQMQVYI